MEEAEILISIGLTLYFSVCSELRGGETCHDSVSLKSPIQHKSISDWYGPSKGRDARPEAASFPALGPQLCSYLLREWAISQDSSQQLLVTRFCRPGFVLGGLGYENLTLR